MITARSTPNIAFIKYWGNRNDALRLPANDSLAMTLHEPGIEISIDHADELAIASTTMGKPKDVSGKHFERFQRYLDLVKQYLATLGAEDAIPASLSIDIQSHIPPAIGLASSAAVFSCMARAISGLVKDHIDLTDEQVSVLARLGSGSATRGIFGGYGAIKIGDTEEIDADIGFQVADENHWLLHDIVIVPSQEEKEVGSTEGHVLAHTSPHFPERIETVQSRRQQECIDAIVKKDFEKLQAVSEEDCMEMHEQIMQQSTPPLHYLNDETYRIIGEVKALREAEHLPALYTMDAGPTVHLFCTEEAVETVKEFAYAQEGCEVFEAKTGSGAAIVG